MIVGAQFAGDDATGAMWQQHDVYREALRMMIAACASHEERAAAMEAWFALFPACPTTPPMGYTNPMSSHYPSPPTLRHQHNGWTPERQQRFLDHLGVHASVAAAARAAGMTKQSAYWLRQQAHSQDFAQRWDEALADTGRWIEDMALDRLRDGEEEVFEREGVVVAVRRRPADVRLLLFHLKRLDREKQKAQANQRRIPPDSSSVAKLRAELRALAAMDDKEQAEWMRKSEPGGPFTSAGG